MDIHLLAHNIQRDVYTDIPAWFDFERVVWLLHMDIQDLKDILTLLPMISPPSIWISMKISWTFTWISILRSLEWGSISAICCIIDENMKQRVCFDGMWIEASGIYQKASFATELSE